MLRQTLTTSEVQSEEGVRAVRQKLAFLQFVLCTTLVFSAIPMVHVRTADAFTSRDLMYGSTGYDVDELQGRLRLIGYYWGHIDGDFGWKTYWAVRTFQYNFGMKVTGNVDMATKIKLTKATPKWHSASSSKSASSPTANGSSKGGTSRASKTAAVFPKSTKGLSQNDLNIMAHVVYGEARGEPFNGQVAIAAVILNRLHSSKFPNTIPGIVYKPGAFSAVSDGQVNLTPNAEAKRAVMDAVNGMDPSHGAIYYFNPAKTTNAFMWSQPEITQIGHHIFTS